MVGVDCAALTDWPSSTGMATTVAVHGGGNRVSQFGFGCIDGDFGLFDGGLQFGDISSCG